MVCHSPLDFNLRLYGRGFKNLTSITIPDSVFQFMPLRKGLLPEHVLLASVHYFNSRPCERGFGNLPTFREGTLYFNSRPCERGFSNIRKKRREAKISIHAPARGASGTYFKLRMDFFISIHAPARGASRTPAARQFLQWEFQFTPLREGLRENGMRIDAYENFNSRPCERGFGAVHSVERVDGYFNSRPCERGFGTKQRMDAVTNNFNSRPCERGFGLLRKKVREPDISIHAPARGASASKRSRGLWGTFQFTPLREGLLYDQTSMADSSDFNSRPCERGFCMLRSGPCYPPRFQFTPLREGLQREINFYCFLLYFNSRPCERGFSIVSSASFNTSISIHAPARGASSGAPFLQIGRVFQFTPLREGLLS